MYTLLWPISMELRFRPIWLAADWPMIFGMKTSFQREHNSEYWPLQLLERSIWKMVLITFSTPSVGTYNLWLSMGVPEDLKQFKKRSHGLVWPILWRWDWEQYKQQHLTSFIFAYTVGGWSFAFCITSCSQQWWLIYDLQCILDCFPMSVSTEPLYSDDQFAHSYSNPYKLYISECNILQLREFYISVDIPGMWFCQNHNVLDKMLYMMRCERIYFLPHDFDNEGNTVRST